MRHACAACSCTRNAPAAARCHLVRSCAPRLRTHNPEPMLSVSPQHAVSPVVFALVSLGNLRVLCALRAYCARAEIRGLFSRAAS